MQNSWSSRCHCSNAVQGKEECTGKHLYSQTVVAAAENQLLRCTTSNALKMACTHTPRELLGLLFRLTMQRAIWHQQNWYRQDSLCCWHTLSVAAANMLEAP